MRKKCIFKWLSVVIFIPVLSISVYSQTEFKITPEDAAPYTQFGWTVSIDGSAAIIGAYTDDEMGLNSGAAYIFRRDSTGWIEEQKLTASDAGVMDNFGWSVSISGDVAIVGAHMNDDAGLNSGSIYIFRFNGTTWEEEAKLTASDAAAEDLFGFSVAIDGNLAIVGAQRNDDMDTDSGTAYVFRYDGSVWNEESILMPNNSLAHAYFGTSVDIKGNTVIVGAIHDEHSNVRTGSAYIYGYTGSYWDYQGKLTAGDGAAGDLFGISVSLDNNYAAVGASMKSDEGSNSGAVYVFEYDGANWNEYQKILPDDLSENHRFGGSVAVENGTMIVGAIGDAALGLYSGAAYIFVNAGSGFDQDLKLLPGDGVEGTRYGIAVDIYNDRVIVSAFLDASIGSGSGSAYIYELDPAEPAESPLLTIEDVITSVEDLELPGGIENSLTSKLTNALKSLEKNNTKAAANQLSAFIYQVEVLMGKKISEEEGQALIDAISFIIEQINAGLGKQGIITEPEEAILPGNFILEQNYPNPFNPETLIRFQLTQPGYVVLKVFNIVGQEVRILVARDLNTGIHTLRWDGRNGNGIAVTSGMYIYKLTAGKFSQMKKMNLVR